MKFRKKPIEVEAWQWDGHSTAPERPEWLRGPNVKADHNEEILKIDTLEGTMTATKGDWIIRGVKGEIYPCKPDIFETSYDKIAELETVKYTPADRAYLCHVLRNNANSLSSFHGDAMRKAADEIERLNKRVCELKSDLNFISSQDRPGGDE